MKYFSVVLLLSAGMLASIVSCSSAKKSDSKSQERTDEPYTASPVSTEQLPETTHAVVTDAFVLPPIPESITNTGERAVYLMMHYWDRFDFTNRKLIDRPEITEQAFVDYISLMDHVPWEKGVESLEYTFNKIVVDTLMYRYFDSLFEKYLYDPNSPFRNEEMYLSVLDEMIASSLITEERRSVLLFQQEMAQKNRVGAKAADFNYTLPSGKSYALHDLKSEYILLIFSNPGCNACETMTEQLNQSKGMKDAFSLNSPERTMLTVLNIYPDEDLNEWLSHLPGMPAHWIHGYDQGMRITHQGLYDIKAIPTLYLLNREKKVILKDASVDAIEAFFSVNI